MKTGWITYHTRKEKLETVALRMRNMTASQSAVAWQKLANKILELSDPAAARTPKFNDLLLSIIKASVRADQRATGIGWVPEGTEIPTSTFKDHKGTTFDGVPVELT